LQDSSTSSRQKPTGHGLVARARQSPFVQQPMIPVTLLGVLVILLAFVAYPVLSIGQESLWLDDRLDPSNYLQVFQSQYYRHTLYNTLAIASLATIGSLLLGTIFALTVTRTDVPGKRFFMISSILPLITPPFFTAFAFVLLLGRQGILNQALDALFGFKYIIYGWHGVILAQSLALFPIAFLTLTAALSAIDPRIEEAAEDLGGGYGQVLRRVTLPLLTPPYLSSAVLIFMFNVSAFGVPTIIGGNRLFFGQASMIAPEAIVQILGRFNWGLGTALAAVILVPALLLFVWQAWYVRRRSYITVTGMPTELPARQAPPPVKWAAFLFCAGVSLFILSIYVVIFAGAFTRTWGVDYSLTTRHLETMLQTSIDSIRNALLLSTGGAITATLIGLVIAYVLSRWRFPGRSSINFLSLMPFALPGVVMGLGLAVAYGSGYVVLVGTGIIIWINYAVRRMPFAIESGKSALAQVDVSLEHAAADLGAGIVRVFRKITIPLLRPTMIAALAFTFIQAMTDITAVIFLVSPRWGLMSVDIYYYILAGRLGVAAAMASVLIVMVVGLLAIIWRVSGLGYRIFRL
jgi:iron(III) transport system permease protein